MTRLEGSNLLLRCMKQAFSCLLAGPDRLYLNSKDTSHWLFGQSPMQKAIEAMA